MHSGFGMRVLGLGPVPRQQLRIWIIPEGLGSRLDEQATFRDNAHRVYRID
jgi:hypothetical protein